MDSRSERRQLTTDSNGSDWRIADSSLTVTSGWDLILISPVGSSSTQPGDTLQSPLLAGVHLCIPPPPPGVGVGHTRPGGPVVHVPVDVGRGDVLDGLTPAPLVRSAAVPGDDVGLLAVEAALGAALLLRVTVGRHLEPVGYGVPLVVQLSRVQEGGRFYRYKLDIKIFSITGYRKVLPSYRADRRSWWRNSPSVPT